MLETNQIFNLIWFRKCSRYRNRLIKNATNKITVNIPDGVKLPDRYQRKPIKADNTSSVTSSITGSGGSFELKYAPSAGMSVEKCDIWWINLDMRNERTNNWEFRKGFDAVYLLNLRRLNRLSMMVRSLNGEFEKKNDITIEILVKMAKNSNISCNSR